VRNRRRLRRNISVVPCRAVETAGNDCEAGLRRLVWLVSQLVARDLGRRVSLRIVAYRRVSSRRRVTGILRALIAARQGMELL